MSWLGEHWGFIVAAYAAGFGLTLAAIVFTIADSVRQKSRLAALEAAGIHRRSQGS